MEMGCSYKYISFMKTTFMRLWASFLFETDQCQFCLYEDLSIKSMVAFSTQVLLTSVTIECCDFSSSAPGSVGLSRFRGRIYCNSQWDSKLKLYHRTSLTLALDNSERQIPLFFFFEIITMVQVNK